MNLRTEITMSLVRALWGEISPEVRAVLARIDGPSGFSVEFYVDAEVTAQFVDDASCIETEIVADFPAAFTISHRVIRLDAPGEIPVGDAVLVYLRKER